MFNNIIIVSSVNHCVLWLHWNRSSLWAFLSKKTIRLSQVHRGVPEEEDYVYRRSLETFQSKKTTFIAGPSGRSRAGRLRLSQVPRDVPEQEDCVYRRSLWAFQSRKTTFSAGPSGRSRAGRLLLSEEVSPQTGERHAHPHPARQSLMLVTSQK